MATPSSGTIKFSDLRNEFGIPLGQSVKISDFRRGVKYIRDNKAVRKTILVNVPLAPNSIRLGQLRGVYKHHAYTFTINPLSGGQAYQNIGIGDIIDGAIKGNLGSYNIIFDPNSEAPISSTGGIPTDSPIYADATISSGVNINGGNTSSSSTQGSNIFALQSSPALRSFVGIAGVDLQSIAYITNNGNIYGTGGNGGIGGGDTLSNGTPGFDGGHAIVYGRTTYLDNYGKVYGAGGGGGGGGFTYGNDDRDGGGGGGGGQGWNISAGGGVTSTNDGNCNFGGCGPNAGSPGGAGGINSPGSGGAGRTYNSSSGPNRGGNGGNGGAWGSDGGRGLYGSLSGSGVSCNSWNNLLGADCGVLDGGNSRSIRRGGERGWAGLAIKHQTQVDPINKMIGTFNLTNYSSGSVIGDVEPAYEGDRATSSSPSGPCVPTENIGTQGVDLAIYRTNCTITYNDNTSQLYQSLYKTSTQTAYLTLVPGRTITYGQLQDHIAGVYRSNLGRPPENTGLEFWRNAFVSGSISTLSDLDQDIINAAGAPPQGNGELLKGGVRSFVDSCGNTFTFTYS